MVTFEIRDAQNDELDFVLSAMKKSQRFSAEWREKPDSVAYGALNPRVNRQVSDSAVLVAAQGRRILGFIVFEVVGDELVLHYVYTRRDYRRQGVARELLYAAVEAARGTAAAVYTTETSRFAALAERYQLEFRP